MVSESWHAIAKALADRMQYHAYCYAHKTPMPDDCPFCADREAYERYQNKVKSNERTQRSS